MSKESRKLADQRYRQRMQEDGFTYKGFWMSFECSDLIRTFNETAKKKGSTNKKVALKIGLKQAIKLLNSSQ